MIFQPLNGVPGLVRGSRIHVNVHDLFLSRKKPRDVMLHHLRQDVINEVPRSDLRLFFHKISPRNTIATNSKGNHHLFRPAAFIFFLPLFRDVVFFQNIVNRPRSVKIVERDDRLIQCKNLMSYVHPQIAEKNHSAKCSLSSLLFGEVMRLLLLTLCRDPNQLEECGESISPTSPASPRMLSG